MKGWPVALAALFIVAAALGFSAASPEYRFWNQSLSVLGAQGMPGWRIANALLFVLPGALMAWAAWRARAGLPADSGIAQRIALQMALLAAVAYALQGVFNLDPEQLPDAGGNRLHALAWLLWSMCLLLAAAFTVLAGQARPGVRLVAVALLLAVPIALWFAPVLGLAAIAQRLLIALWLLFGLTLMRD